MEIYEFLDGISMEMIGILLTISPMSINFKVFAGVWTSIRVVLHGFTMF